MPLDIRFVLPPELVVLPLALVAVAIVAYRSRLAPTRTILGRVAATVYLAAVVWVTLFPFQVSIGVYGNTSTLGPIQFIPLLLASPAGMLLNVLLFVPLGALLAEVWGVRGWRRVALVGFVASLAIELAQLAQSTFLGGGRAFDVDDLIANTAGALAGYGLYVAVARTSRSSIPHAEP